VFSYYRMCCTQVVVAVLLDEFVSQVTLEKEEKERLDHLEQQKRKISGCLDPLTKSLVFFEDHEDLAVRARTITHAIARVHDDLTVEN